MKHPCSVLVRGARIYDGTGAPPYVADLAIDGDRISRLGSLDALTASIEIDGEALSLAPGFIDVHTHDDFAALRYPDLAFKTRGGVTTCIVGNCGFGPAPFEQAVSMIDSLTPGPRPERWDGHAGYAAVLEARGIGANVGVLAGHGTLRLAAMGRDAREPEVHELETMKSMLREALDAGALGLSSGLIYDPGKHATTNELADLASVMRGSGALYATHMRDEAEGLVASVEEAITIGARAGVPVQISHHKAAGRDNWGLVSESLRLIEAAQARGESVHADQYPYTAGSTMLRAILENGAFQPGVPGGIGKLLPEDVLVASAPGRIEWEGRTIAALSKEFDLDARQAAEQVVTQAPGATAVLHMMSEDDVRTVLRHASTMIGSDGLPTLEGRPHPRLFGSFARVLGHYARDEGVLDMATAIHRMTGFSAGKFGLVDRGLIREGAYADLVLFDPASIIDRGTYEDPNRYPAGIDTVIVNGIPVVRAGEVQRVLPGRVLRRGN